MQKNGGIIMFFYKKADLKDLERIWDRNISDNPGDDRYIRWKKQFIDDNQRGAAVTFVILHGNDPIGEGTLLLSPDCRAIRGRTELCDGVQIANINALRIQPEFEGQGHISKLMQEIENYAKSIGIRQITIGVEAAETRNLGIYLHWGYNKLVMHETEDGELILYYGKQI